MQVVWRDRLFPVLSASVLSVIVVGSMLWILYARPIYIAQLVHRDVMVLAKTLKQIDRDCAITSIQQNRVPINFLSVKSFSGSEVGSISVAYPNRWQGPYMNDSPSLQRGIFYDIVKLKEGYCVVPGLGATLPNGLTVGRDFELHSGVSFKTLTMPGGHLNYHDIVMGMFLDFPIGDLKTEEGKLPEDFTENLDRIVREFNEAMAYSFNEGFFVPSTRALEIA